MCSVSDIDLLSALWVMMYWDQPPVLILSSLKEGFTIKLKGLMCLAMLTPVSMWTSANM